MEIIDNSEAILNQLNNLVTSLTPTELVKPLKTLNGSTIGQHTRHILEFYVEFIHGYKSGTVCYDNRKRNTDFETSQIIISSKIGHIIGSLKDCDLSKAIKIKSNHGLKDFTNTQCDSSVLRELIYALDHTIHHLAIVKIALDIEFKHIQSSKNLGVAPSTIRHNQKTCVQ